MRPLKARGSPKAPAVLFAALADETRLRLVARLCDHGPMSITNLAEGAAVSRQAIAKHLRVMEKARLAYSERQGRESVWRLDAQRLDAARNYLSSISKQWDDALGRLRKFVED